MDTLLLFIASRFLTKSFWILVFSTFFGVLLFAMRGWARNEMFQDASRFAFQAARSRGSYASRF